MNQSGGVSGLALIRRYKKFNEALHESGGLNQAGLTRLLPLSSISPIVFSLILLSKIHRISIKTGFILSFRGKYVYFNYSIFLVSKYLTQIFSCAINLLNRGLKILSLCYAMAGSEDSLLVMIGKQTKIQISAS